MLKIRPEQMKALGARRQEDFERRLKDHLREVFPGRLEDSEDADAQLEEWTRAGLEGSTLYGIRLERDVMLFTDLQIGLEPDLKSSPKLKWARKILADEDLSGTAKIELIHKQLPARNPEYLTE